MKIATAELFLAYRQAKSSLQQEQGEPWRVRWASAEQDLPGLLTRTRRHLAETPNWFSRIDIGQVWLLPKKATQKMPRTGVRHIGGDYSVQLERLAVRPHLAPSPEFSTLEVLWLWHFGAALESLLGPKEVACGNRLKLINNRTEFHRHAIGCYEFWPPAYQGYRDRGFEEARRLLTTGRRRRCLMASFDLASYYDEIEPNFLIRDSFIDELAERARKRGVSLNVSLYRLATSGLLRAFGRYRRACEALTGIPTERGIPIGCLSSKLISNVVLAPLDEYVQSRPGVKYYARYVDDMLLVATPHAKAQVTEQKVARAFLPIDLKKTKRRSRDIHLDEELLGRPRSQLRLQPSKIRTYVLVGTRGKDFLDTIERNVKLIASERRAFLLPDGLGSDSPLKALFVGSDSESPVQVLRDVDRLKVERYAAGVAVSKASVSVELLDPPDAAAWCRNQLGPLSTHLTSPEQWLEFIELAMRALCVCMRAGDTATARRILRRHEVHLARLSTTRGTVPVLWNRRRLPWRRSISALQHWYENRLVEELASCLPLQELDSRTADGLLRRVFGREPRIGTKRLRVRSIAAHATLLFSADLRAIDRETDLLRYQPPGVFQTPRRWGRLARAVRTHSATSERVAGIERFIRVCRSLRQDAFRASSAIDVLLLTRPPTQFDIARRWTQAKRPVRDLPSITNAIRGNRYPSTAVQQVDERTVRIVTLEWLFGEPDPLQVVLGNLRTKEEWWKAAAEGKPIVSRQRMESIGRIVNEAIRLKARSRGPTLLVLPELSLPERLLRPLAYRLVQEKIGLVAGLEYEHTPKGVINQAVGVLTPGYQVVAVCWWPKTKPARKEQRDLLDLNKDFVTHDATSLVVETDHGAIGTLICSELLDVGIRSKLLGRVDLLVVPAWNQDTATFDHTVQTVANDLHCYTAVANNALYSDCRIQVPSRERHLRDACRLILRNEDEVIAFAIDVAELRKFQLASLTDPKLDPGTFKPLPPSYKFRRG